MKATSARGEKVLCKAAGSIQRLRAVVCSICSGRAYIKYKLSLERPSGKPKDKFSYYESQSRECKHGSTSLGTYEFQL